MASPLRTHVAAGSLSHTSFSGLTAPVLCGAGQRTKQSLAPRAYGEGSGASISTQESPVAGSIKVRVTPPKPVSVPPSPPSLIHSPVYVQNKLIKPSVDGMAVLPPAVSSGSYGADEEEEGAAAGGSNVLMSALRNVDRSLDELEQNPLPLQREIYELSRSPVGTATGSALTTAAKVTVAATKEAVKAAVPVGQWVLREGAKAAMTLMSRATAEAARKQVEGGTGTTKISVKKRPEGSSSSSKGKK